MVAVAGDQVLTAAYGEIDGAIQAGTLACYKVRCINGLPSRHQVSMGGQA